MAIKENTMEIKENKNSKPGFKKTMMGWIPMDWEVSKLGFVAKIQTGIAKGKKDIKNPISLPYLRVANVQDGYLDLKEVKLIQLPKEKVDRYLLRVDDVLMTEGGDFDKLGRGTIWKGEIDNCLHQNHVFVVRTDKDKLLPYFLNSFTKTELGKRYFILCSKQSTNLASINSSQLKQFPIVLPPLPEQQKIATILSTWDKAIDKLEQLIEAKEEQQKGLMQRLLTGKVRISGFSQSWIKKTIGKILKESKIKGNGNDTSKRLTVRLNLKGISKREVRGTEVVGATNFFRRKFGQFIYGKQNLHKGAMGIIPKEFDNYETTSDIPSFDFYENVNPKWFLFYMSRPSFYQRLENISTGTGSKRIKPEELFKIKINTPSFEEQEAIAKILSEKENEIKLLKMKMDAIKEQKKGLMQRLLTGKIRVQP